MINYWQKSTSNTQKTVDSDWTYEYPGLWADFFSNAMLLAVPELNKPKSYCNGRNIWKFLLFNSTKQMACLLAMLAWYVSSSSVVFVSSNFKSRSSPYQLLLAVLFFWCECLPFERSHLVQTAHVNSLPSTYGRHGSDPHTPSTG